MPLAYLIPGAICLVLAIAAVSFPMIGGGLLLVFIGVTVANLPGVLLRVDDVDRSATADEIVRSLPKRGANAGCSWDGVSRRADCDVGPDKETPLWAPDQPPIYMWAADEVDAEEARYVSYNGWINAQPMRWGNPRHTYRCVRER